MKENVKINCLPNCAWQEKSLAGKESRVLNNNNKSNQIKSSIPYLIGREKRQTKCIKKKGGRCSFSYYNY